MTKDELKAILEETQMQKVGPDDSEHAHNPVYQGKPTLVILSKGSFSMTVLAEKLYLKDKTLIIVTPQKQITIPNQPDPGQQPRRLHYTYDSVVGIGEF